MKINTTDTNLSRRNWLQTATVLGALGLALPQAGIGQLLAQEEAPNKRSENSSPKYFKDSAADFFNFAKGEQDTQILQRSGNGRDILYEILRQTSKTDFANKSWSVRGKDGWDYILDLREFAMYVLDAKDPKRPGALNDNFVVQNLRKETSVKVSLDEIIDFGINVKSAPLACFTVGAIAAGWSHYTLPTALKLINTYLEILHYDQSTQSMRRNIERVVANKLFGETAVTILSEAFKYKFEIGKDDAQYKSGDSFNTIAILAKAYDDIEKHRQSMLRNASRFDKN